MADTLIRAQVADAGRERSGRSNWIWTALPYLAAVVLLGFWGGLVRAYSVNILFSDQWDLYRPFIEGESAWRSFFLQHGPHRQGLGGLLNHLLAGLSGLSVIAETRVIVFALFLCAVLAIGVKRMATGQIGPADIGIPFLVMNPIQCETIIVVPNIAHSVFPLLLYFATALIFLKRRTLWSPVLLTAVLAASLFTGFGLFVFLSSGVLILSIMLEDTAPPGKRLLKLAPFFLIAMGALLVFLTGYAINRSGLSEVANPVPAVSYLYFVGHLFGRFFNLDTDGRLWIGLGLLALTLSCLASVFWGGRRFLQSRPQALIVFSILVSLSYAVFSSLGRISIFIERNAGTPFRYTTLIVPAFFALFLSASMVRTVWLRRLGATGFCLLAVTSFVSSVPPARSLLVRHQTGKSLWVSSYLETNDAGATNRITGYAIYPAPDLIEDRLKILTERNLNFRKDFPPLDASDAPLIEPR